MNALAGDSLGYLAYEFFILCESQRVNKNHGHWKEANLESRGSTSLLVRSFRPCGKQ